MDLRRSGVDAPDRKIQGGGERDPCEVGDEQVGGRFADAVERGDGGGDGKPHQRDVDQGEIDAVQTEEKGRPEGVEEPLEHEESEGGGAEFPAAGSPNEPGSDGHGDVEQRPDWAKEPTGWVPRGLVEICEPLAHGDEHAGCRSGEANDEPGDERDDLPWARKWG